MVWEGKWWILLIGLICLGLAVGLAALLKALRPEHGRVSGARCSIAEATCSQGGSNGANHRTRRQIVEAHIWSSIAPAGSVLRTNAQQRASSAA
jgi:hypothetical protein